MEEHKKKKNKLVNGYIKRGVGLLELESDFIRKNGTTHTLRLKSIKDHNPNKNISLEKKKEKKRKTQSPSVFVICDL